MFRGVLDAILFGYCMAMHAIFDYVFKPSQPRLTLVAMLDWSQGHAAMSHDRLDAENMLVNPGGITAHHIKATRTPQPPVTYNVMPSGRQIPVYSKPWPKRAPECHSCSKKSPADTCSCREANDEASRRGINDSDFQTIGDKGLKQVLVERNCDVTGKNQGELVTMLQEFSDFAKRTAITRAHVTEIFKANKHVALFGVIYHADLAHVERQWMFIKQQKAMSF